ncbi:unnamed protein product, partial [Schistocephalus solidus]|uniref:Myb-like DNA-binding domain protein n=1 Tax=Schistocephalus solidus TaxID=70667 RepID=A0A183THM2_SCHSO
MSTINQIRSTVRESGPSGSEEEDDLDSDLQILEPPTLLTREEMEALLQPMRKKLGDDHETGLLITNALNHDEESMQKFCKFVPDGRLRESFLATIVSLEWVFYFLAAVNGSARTLMGLLDTLADKSEANRTNAQAVVKLLTGQLGEGPYLKPFYNAFMQCREVVTKFCVKRGANQTEVEAVFRECLCEMDDEYENLGDMIGLQVEEVQQVTQLTKTCQMEALTQYLSSFKGRDRGGDLAGSVGQERRIANLDADDVDFIGPESANEDEARGYNRLDSTSPAQSTIFTDGAGLELPEFIDEPSEELDTISEAKTDRSPLADIRMEAPPLMVDDEPPDTRPRTPILKGKTPMRFQKGAKTKTQGGGPATFVSSDATTEVGRASTINDIKVEERADSESREVFNLEVQPEVTVDDLLPPEEGERGVSGTSGPDRTVRADDSRRGHRTAAEADKEPRRYHKKKKGDSSEPGAAKELDAEDAVLRKTTLYRALSSCLDTWTSRNFSKSFSQPVEEMVLRGLWDMVSGVTRSRIDFLESSVVFVFETVTPSQKRAPSSVFIVLFLQMSPEEAAKHDEASLEELLQVAASENSPEVVSEAMEKLLDIVGKGRVSTEAVLQILDKLSGIYNKRMSDFQAMEPNHMERQSIQRVLEILKLTMEKLGLPAEDQEIPEDTLG